MYKRPNVLIILSFLLLSDAACQYYETGQDPASLRWVQIKTERFNVIYPEDYGKGGIDFARALEKGYAKLTALYPAGKFRIPVVIHNHTTQSNGYVAWAPRRMEVYPTPEQNTIPLDANTQLAIHELAHVLQMNSLNRGTTKIMTLLTGEQFPGAVSSLIPLWFLEGDAVFSETVLTQSGRGRSPSFLKQLKAISNDRGKMYNYDKIVNGSFRDFVPDHYRTGYQITAWSHYMYGQQLLKNAVDFTGAHPFTLNPFNISLLKSRSLTKRKLFNETFDTLALKWAAEKTVKENQMPQILTSRGEKEYINYYSPVVIGEDSIAAVKTCLYDAPAFVILSHGGIQEKKIHIPGPVYPFIISCGKGRLVWVETQYDPRWENRTWSVIKILDLKSLKARQLTHRTRYMAASVSPDGNFIAATENTTDNINRLVIIDAWNGDLISVSPAPGNAHLQSPRWDDKGKTVTVITLGNEGEGISSYNTLSLAWDTLISAGRDDIQSAFINNDSLFYVSSVSGTENIYLLTPGKNVVPLTSSDFGATDPFVKGKSLIYSDYTSLGNNIARIEIDKAAGNLSIPDRSSSMLINSIAATSQEKEAINEKEYNPVPYRKWQHLFRFHSWMPFYADIEEIKNDPAAIKPGFSLMTQNHLSTLISSVGYEYAEGMHKLHSRVKWLGWPVVIDSRVDYGDRPSIYKSKDTIPDPAEVRKGSYFYTTLYLPLSFQTGKFSQYLYLSASSVYQNNYIHIRETGRYDYGQMMLTGRIFFSNYHRSSFRDIHPRWAQIIDLSHTFYPFDSKLYGNISTVKSAFYFPGFMRNNGIKLRAEAEIQSTEKFLLANRASFSRSYRSIVSERLQFYSFDYFLPLGYPDLSIPGLLYIKRIRADLFYDITRGTGNYILGSSGAGRSTAYHGYTESFKSFGLELMTDFHLLRIPFMISAGVQSAWRPAGTMPYVQFLFNIDLFGMNIGKNRI